MTNTQNLLESAKNEVGHVLAHITSAWVNGQALRALHSEREKQFLFDLSQHGAPDPLNISNSASHIFHHVRSERFREFQAIKTALVISEASEDFRAACLVMDPLIAEVRRLEQKLQDEQTAYGEKMRLIQEAEYAALEKARAAIEADPKVAKLREEAEATRPPHIEAPPFRGRVELKVATAETAAAAK